MKKKSVRVALRAALLLALVLAGLLAFSHHRARVVEGDNADAGTVN